jgi:hypothetical protein
MPYTSPTKVACTVVLKEHGHSDQEIGEVIGVHRTTVACLLAKQEEVDDPYYVKPKPGRPRVFSERDARLVALQLARCDIGTATEAAKRIFPDVSRSTIARRLHDLGLVSRVRRSRPFISEVNIIKHRDWANEYFTWTEEDWSRVIFSDESKFMLFHSDGHEYAWFRPGQALDPQFTKKSVKHGSGSLMVWGCVTATDMGRLFRIEGKLNGESYVDILEKQLLGTVKDLKLRKTGPLGVIFQQDNDSKHTCCLAKAWFDRRRIKKLPWAPQSPDMNIIEHVWHQLDLRVRARNPLPRNKDELWVALQEEWAAFPLESLKTLYESMPRRVAALKAARGGHTKY